MSKSPKSLAKSIGLQLIVYLLGLWAGIFSGALPLFVLLSGVPFILISIDHSMLHASIALAIALVGTWVSMDMLSFILVSIGVVSGASLAWWYALKRPLKESFLWSGGSAVLWLLFGNLLQIQFSGSDLLTSTRDALTQGLDTMLQTMSELGAYSTDQVAEFSTVMQQGIELFTEQWPYFVVALVAVSTITNLSFARVMRRQQLGHLDWLVLQMPAWLAGLTVLSKAVNHFTPTIVPVVTSNIWNAGSFLLVLSALSLCFFFLRHWRVSPIVRAIFLMYVLTSPWLWRVLFLVGVFDSFFNYRFYARTGKAEK